MLAIKELAAPGLVKAHRDLLPQIVETGGAVYIAVREEAQAFPHYLTG